MSETQTNKASNHNINHLKIQIIVGFAVLIPVMLFLIIIVFKVRMTGAMKQQSADMLQNLNVQIKNNVSSYMDTIAGNVNMMVSDSEVSGYIEDRSQDIDREYIESKMSSYALYSDYTDYGVVFSDNSTLGLVSDKLKAAGGDKLYATIDKAMIKSGNWTTELIPGRESITYLSRINDTTIAVASVPSARMTADMNDVLFIDGMNIYLTDKSLVVISTTDPSITPGSYLKTNISRLVDRIAGSTQIGDQYVVATQKMDNRWYVITAIPSDDVTATLKSTIRYVILISVFAALLAIGYVVYMTQRIINSVNQTVDRLDVKAQTDLLTGLINKRSFEEIVEMTLNNPEQGYCYAMIFMDIDNFKGVNDRCGHDVGDLVLKSFSHTIDTVFRETDIKGRLGGDEFCVLMKMAAEDRDQLINHINEVCKRFVEYLHRKANSARQSLPAVTSSMGAALWEGAPEGFEELYHKADTALYASKKNGKDTWTIYGQGVTGEKNKDEIASEQPREGIAEAADAVTEAPAAEQPPTE